MRVQASILAAAALASLPARALDAPSHERLPLQVDFDRCVLKIADSGNENIQGRLRLQLLIRPAGNVFAAFVHSEKGVNDRRLERCITATAVLWKLPPVAVDYSRAYELTFVPGGTEIDFSEPLYKHGDHFAGPGRASVFMPDMNDPPHDASLDPAAAQQTLEIADWATAAERGIADLEVHKYAEAIPTLRQALAGSPSDPLALRGLAVALAESRTDVREARYLAERLVSIAPSTEPSHETLLRVCLAASDDPCVFEQFALARDAPDVAPRSRQLKELQPAVERVAARLRALAMASDRCVREKDEEGRALCVVRRCLDFGTGAFADELAGEKHSPWEARDWRVVKLGLGRFVVTRPLTDGRDRRDLRWLVKVSDAAVRMTPTNADARHVTTRHSACAVAQASGPGSDLAKAPAIDEQIDRLVQKK